MSEDSRPFTVQLTRRTGSGDLSVLQGFLTLADVCAQLPALIKEVFGLTISIEEYAPDEPDHKT